MKSDSDQTLLSGTAAFFLAMNSFEQWEAEGRQDAPTRANRIFKRMLSEYEEPTLDPAIDEALKEFIAKKKAAVPDSNV